VFHQLPPFVAPGFWSVTMYDGTNNYTVPNPINRYSLGSDNQLKTAADGTTTLYIQHASPGAALQSNWLPAPSGSFYLILRSYAPGPAMIRTLSVPGAYALPQITLVK
jgi:DNA sulfur modification protein DndE